MTWNDVMCKTRINRIELFPGVSFADSLACLQFATRPAKTQDSKSAQGFLKDVKTIGLKPGSHDDEPFMTVSESWHS